MFCSSKVKRAIDSWARDTAAITGILDLSEEPRVRVNERETEVVVTVTDRRGKKQHMQSDLKTIMNDYGH